MIAAEGNQRDLFDIRQRLGSTVEGTVTAQDWDNRFVTVDLGGTSQTMRWKGAAPWPGDRVRVDVSAGSAVCELVMGAPLGTVQSTSAGVAVVLGDDSVTYSYPHLGSAPANGSRVRLDHAGRCVPSGTYTVEPANSEYTPSSVPPVPAVKERWFDPVWSGNWRSGAYQGPAVEISTTRTGAYGYGTQIRDTIPASATVTVATLYLTENWDNVPGVASDMGTHSQNGVPGSFGDGSLSGSYAVPGTEQSLLGTVIAELRAGTALGIGFRSNGGASGWRQYAAAPASGRIFVKWQ